MKRFDGSFVGDRPAWSYNNRPGVWSNEQAFMRISEATWSGPDRDPYIANVSLLLHADGSDGSTTFIDSSPGARTLTAYGNAQISTAQSKFGGSSASFDGNGDYLTCPTSGGAFDFGADNFTIEAWIYLRSNSTNRTICGVWFNDSLGSFRLFLSSGVLNIAWGTGQGMGSFGGSTVLSLNAWHHVAFVRNVSTGLLFADGAQEGSAGFSGTVRNAYSNLQVGRNEAGNTWFMDGYMDELRITKTIARYTSGFTPPIAPFPNS